MTQLKAYAATLALITTIGFHSIAQKDSTTSLVGKVSSGFKIDESRRLFAEGNIRAALVGFREAFNKDPYSAKAAYWIGKCQYELSNYGFALKYADIAKKLTKDTDPEVNFLMGESYHRIGELDSAIIEYNTALNSFTPQRAADLFVKRDLEEAVRAKEWSKKPATLERSLYNGDINTGFHDYAPILTDGGKRIYFASRRSGTTGGQVNPDDQMFFEDIFSGVWNEKMLLWDSISNNGFKRLNSEGFDAISHITTDGNEIYITVNNTMVPDVKKPTMSSDIMLAKKSAKGSWSSPKAIKEINSSFFDGGATLTADGSTMYFVSERTGTKGGADIWVSKLNGHTWSKPVNLGDKINTKGQETTPYITPDGKHLFFSSNNRDGIGGYDVYVAEFNGTDWSTPINMGKEVNSVNNDTHFRYYPELKKAVMAAIRLIDNKSSYDIFFVDMSNYQYPKFEF